MVNTFEVHNWLSAAREEPDESKIPLILNLLEEEIEEMKEGLKNKDYKEIMDGAADAIVILNNIIYYSDIHAKEFVRYCEAVIESNWSKYCNSEEEAIDTVQAYLNGTHPSKPGESIETFYEKSADDKQWIVKRTDGKILKSINYKSPDFYL